MVRTGFFQVEGHQINSTELKSWLERERTAIERAGTAMTNACVPTTARN